MMPCFLEIGSRDKIENRYPLHFSVMVALEEKKMDIPMNAQVYCNDRLCSRVTYVIIDATSKKVTHLVVRQKEAPHTERMIPIEWVSETSHDLIRLRCTTDELNRMQSFFRTEYVRHKMPDLELRRAMFHAGFRHLQVRKTITKTISVRQRNIPLGELAVHRGAQVKATDGRVGRIDEFLVDPTDDHITHLVLREGHLWGRKDVTIPASQIDRIEGNVVHLKLDKHSVQELPAVPAR
jgi:sporulation protein YlmC with PRC-barrel domain